MKKYTKAFDAGLTAKREEIGAMGFADARDKFNLDCPAGIKWQGSAEGLEYFRGEMAALEDAIAKGLHR